MVNNKKVLFICNKGGHYSQMLQLKELMSKFDSIVVSDKKNGAKDWDGVADYKCLDAYNIKKIRLPYFIKNIFECFGILIKNRPKYIVTTGAGLAIPMFIIGRLCGIKLIFIESRARVYTKSASGKILGKFSHKVIVQWPEMLRVYGEKANYYGTLV